MSRQLILNRVYRFGLGRNALPRCAGMLMLAGLVFMGVGFADTIRIGFVGQHRHILPALSNLDTQPADQGIAGAELGIDDNNTSGKFTGQKFELVAEIVTGDASTLETVRRMAQDGIAHIILDLPTTTLMNLLEQVDNASPLLINAASRDRVLRDDKCHPNLLHTILSRDMQSDALAQFLVKKRWIKWFVVTGPQPEDSLFAESLARSAKKFGAKIVEQKRWNDRFDARRLAQNEVPLFTQGVDYDVLMVADEIGDFGNYLLFQTHAPRPVAGTQGLTAQAWGKPLEQWGARQLQERFLDKAGRWMRDRDYAAWLGVRAIGEAALRTGSGDPQVLTNYIKSDQFKLAGFKGRKLTFRPWNGQLRQPVPLMWSSALVAQAPIDGYLHRHSEMDTLGLDQPESRCQLP